MKKYIFDEHGFFSWSADVPVGIDYLHSTEIPVPDEIPADGFAWCFIGGAWVEREKLPPVVEYKKRGLDVTDVRKLCGIYVFLADRVRADIAAGRVIDYLEGEKKLSDPAVEVGLGFVNYEDVLRSTFDDLYSAPVINCDDDLMMRGVEAFRLTGIIPDQATADKILRGVPIL